MENEIQHFTYLGGHKNNLYLLGFNFFHWKIMQVLKNLSLTQNGINVNRNLAPVEPIRPVCIDQLSAQ